MTKQQCHYNQYAKQVTCFGNNAIFFRFDITVKIMPKLDRPRSFTMDGVNLLSQSVFLSSPLSYPHKTFQSLQHETPHIICLE